MLLEAFVCSKDSISNHLQSRSALLMRTESLRCERLNGLMTPCPSTCHLDPPPPSGSTYYTEFDGMHRLSRWDFSSGLTNDSTESA